MSGLRHHIKSALGRREAHHESGVSAFLARGRAARHRVVAARRVATSKPTLTRRRKVHRIVRRGPSEEDMLMDMPVARAAPKRRRVSRAKAAPVKRRKTAVVRRRKTSRVSLRRRPKKKYVMQKGRVMAVGSKLQVWRGQARHTSGGLKKGDLMKNKWGRIVSRRKHAAGLRAAHHLRPYIRARRH